MKALALVIGNSNYQNDKDKLKNAANNAEDFGQKLLQLGFFVKKATNCNKEKLDREIRSFCEELKKFDVGLFYFSGHGLQIEGKNYLTSIDTNFDDPISAKYTSYPIDQLIEYMHQTNITIKILILDAWINNSLPYQYRNFQVNNLAPISAPRETIIAYSALPNEIIIEKNEERNSIYTASL